MSLENLTMRDLQEFREVSTKDLTVGEFKKKLRDLRDKYNLTDQEALQAHRQALKMLPEPSDWI